MVMEKISNKLRLVRSQSIGVNHGGNIGEHFNNLDDKPVSHRAVLSNNNNSIRSGGRLASIVMLDERRLETQIQSRLYAGELLDMVASHCGLREKEFFGLAVVDENGHYTWLQLDRKVLDHDLPSKPSLLTVHFLVKFFIESISSLVDNRTVELFYLQARSLIFRGTLEAEADLVFQLAALAIQSNHGDIIDDASARTIIKKSPVLPVSVLKEHPSLVYCEDRVIEHYKNTRGQTRGQSIVNYMTIIESMPTYGVHYFEVFDKRQTPWWLGLSCRGISQYHHTDRQIACRVFQWKQLENLYFRDKKFSIEVHDTKRVVQTMGSLSLYEDALKIETQNDGLAEAINESTTHVSVSRRSFNPGSIHVYVWFGKTQSLTKCIWQSAISQHQFYLDRKQAKLRRGVPPRTLNEIARDLTHSSISLSSAGSSSISNISRADSVISIAVGAGSVASEETQRARLEMISALKARKEAIESKLKEKISFVKELCVREGELTGKLPSDIPLAPGEDPPRIRRRMGTTFTLSEDVLSKGNTHNRAPEDDLIASLELDLEIQSKITSAALKLSNDVSLAKSVRRKRKIFYQQSQRKFKDIETKLNTLKHMAPSIKQQRRLQRRQMPPPPLITNILVRSKDITNSSGQFSRGFSVPDLGTSSVSTRGDDESDDSPASIEAEVPSMTPSSCPTSPRKNSLPQIYSADSLSLDSNCSQGVPSRGVPSGYIPSSIYIRSSYRSKQYPTLSTIHRPTPILPPPTSSSQLYPVKSASLSRSPYRNKFEARISTNCDSPLGLYNCPQQRTSQAFSSLDDLDTLTHRTIVSDGEFGKERLSKPVVENAVKCNNTASQNHFPSLERSAQRKYCSDNVHVLSNCKKETPSRSLEDISSLEAAGIRCSSKLKYREVQNKTSDDRPPLTVDEADTGGPYPSSVRSNALLPGQTYPEPNPSSSTTLPALQEALMQRSQMRKQQRSVSGGPPPLFPKHYYQAVEQRRRSGHCLPPPPLSPQPSTVSPVVNRRSKPTHITSYFESSSETPSNSNEDTLSLTPSSTSSLGKFVAYKETTKPFEMSDFYKYSTKYRKASVSSASNSPRSSTASITAITNGGSDFSDGAPRIPASSTKPPYPAPRNTLDVANSVANDFSSELLTWYNNAQQKPKNSQQTGKPATLV